MPNGDGIEARRINVLATGSVDQTVKVGLFLNIPSFKADTPFYRRSGHPSIATVIIFSQYQSRYILYIYTLYKQSHTHIPTHPRLFFVKT